MSVIFNAIRRGDLGRIKAFVLCGGDINTTYPHKYTLLYSATVFGKSAIVKFLIDSGADSNIGDATGQTPLHCAASRNDREIMKLLLQAGANPNVEDVNWRTPLLSLSVTRLDNNPETVKMLLDFGADCNFFNERGDSALSVARERKRTRTTNVMEQWPQIVPLRTFCLRIILVRTNNVCIPSWVPPILLEWPTLEEMNHPSKKLK